MAWKDFQEEKKQGGISIDGHARSPEQENKLNEMFKQVGLVLEDFSSSQSFQQSANDRQKDETKNNLSEVSKTNKPSDKEQEDNYIEDESLLNIKV